MGTCPPPCIPHACIASQRPPPTNTIVWLVVAYLHQEAATQDRCSAAPPISQFFHGRHFSAQNKGTKRSARKPGRRVPLLGSWGAAAPQFRSVADVAMEREGKAAGGIVGWQRLILVVCRVWWLCMLGKGPKLGFP
jgi:hypothetical protein